MVWNLFVLVYWVFNILKNILCFKKVGSQNWWMHASFFFFNPILYFSFYPHFFSFFLNIKNCFPITLFFIKTNKGLELRDTGGGKTQSIENLPYKWIFVRVNKVNSLFFILSFSSYSFLTLLYKLLYSKPPSTLCVKRYILPTRVSEIKVHFK